MLGIIQKVLCDLIEKEGGPTALHEVRQAAQIPPERAFRIHEPYSDEEFQRFVGQTLAHFGWPVDDFYARYADLFLVYTHAQFPTFFKLAKNSREFLQNQPTIHHSFAAGALSPAQRKEVVGKFHLDRTEDGLVMHYSSPHRLCGLYKALALRTAKFYGDKMEISESACLHNGASECEIHIRWTEIGSPA